MRPIDVSSNHERFRAPGGGPVRRTVRWVMALLAPVCALLALGGPARGEVPWPTFQGAWFEVEYPPGFAVEASIESPSMAGRFDSVSFVSADGAVAFYVYSPQWSGEPTDIALHDGSERMVAEKRSEKGTRVVRWYTIAASDGAYARSYQDTVDTVSGTRTVVGLRYRSDAERKRHASQYQRFKKSLRQFAD
ncbi:MAG: hypothetical protein H6983_01510 [Ectothiorhodospiraceae bacterium]|nr:hypothetical protein [Ectothiorhodospiraceae bacterium]